MGISERISGCRRQTKLLVCLLVGIVLFLSFLTYRAFFCPIAPGISAGGVDISGLSGMEARTVLKRELGETLYQQELAVILPEQTLYLSPKNCKVSVNLTRLVQHALHRGPSDSREIPLLPYLKVDEAYIRSLLTDYAAKYDTELSEPSWHLEGTAPVLTTDAFDFSAPCQTLVLTMGIPSLHLDVSEVYGNILSTYSNAIPLCKEDAYHVTPKVQPEAIPHTPDAAAILAEVAVAAADDSVDRTTFTFLHGSYGLTFDSDQLERNIRNAAYGDTITLSLEYVQPDIVGEDAYFQDVLGAYETRHTNDENRNTNLRLLCEALDGHVLQPGDEFSFNGVVGERTKERGYKPAPAYSGNRLTSSYGGGVCQGSTTLYNCVLLADLEVVFRACHGAKVGYVPLGLDASVNWLTTDFKFRNNFNCPIKLQAEVSDGYVKMKILGTDEKDYYIKMETGSGEDDAAWYARSYKCKYSKETDELISRDIEAYSTYYKNIG